MESDISMETSIVSTFLRSCHVGLGLSQKITPTKTQDTTTFVKPYPDPESAVINVPYGCFVQRDGQWIHTASGKSANPETGEKLDAYRKRLRKTMPCVAGREADAAGNLPIALLPSMGDKADRIARKFVHRFMMHHTGYFGALMDEKGNPILKKGSRLQIDGKGHLKVDEQGKPIYSEKPPYRAMLMVYDDKLKPSTMRQRVVQTAMAWLDRRSPVVKEEARVWRSFIGCDERSKPEIAQIPPKDYKGRNAGQSYSLTYLGPNQSTTRSFPKDAVAVIPDVQFPENLMHTQGGIFSREASRISGPVRQQERKQYQRDPRANSGDNTDKMLIFAQRISDSTAPGRFSQASGFFQRGLDIRTPLSWDSYHEVFENMTPEEAEARKKRRAEWRPAYYPSPPFTQRVRQMLDVAPIITGESSSLARLGKTLAPFWRSTKTK